VRNWEDAAEDYARQALAAGNATEWFDRFYSAGVAGEITMPWGRTQAHPLLVDRLTREAAHHGRAVVVGCGLGADAEYLASLGYGTTAFDVAPTAVQQCRLRYPGSAVDYRLADLFDLPDEWRAAFDLVVEIVTVQALPTDLHPRAIAAVRSLVAPGGRLIVIGWALEPDEPPPAPPWPLTRGEIDSFATDGLHAVAIEQVAGSEPVPRRWRAEFVRDPKRASANGAGAGAGAG
jgi:SAM-dependent methyltransferase